MCIDYTLTRSLSLDYYHIIIVGQGDTGIIMPVIIPAIIPAVIIPAISYKGAAGDRMSSN